MLSDLNQEPLKALFSLQNLFRLIIVPINESILGRYGRNNTGWVAVLKYLRDPFEILVASVDWAHRISYLQILLEPSLYLVQTE